MQEKKTIVIQKFWFDSLTVRKHLYPTRYADYTQVTQIE